jgi:hypothetical protein
MTNSTRTLYFAEFILARIAINLPLLERDVDLSVIDIIGDSVWALLTVSEKISIGSNFSYMVKHDLIPFVFVGKTPQNASIYRLK